MTGARAAEREARYRAKLAATAIEESWEPACFTPEELTSWRAKNRALQSGLRDRNDRPCIDCTLAFAVEQRALGRCNGEPGGVQDNEAEDERFLTKEVGPDRRALELLAQAVTVAPVAPTDGRLSRFLGRHVPLGDVKVPEPPQPGSRAPIDPGALLDHVRSVGFAAHTPDKSIEEEEAAMEIGEKQTQGTCVICGTVFMYRRRGQPRMTCDDPACDLARRRERVKGIRHEAVAEPVLERSPSSDQAPGPDGARRYGQAEQIYDRANARPPDLELPEGWSVTKEGIVLSPDADKTGWTVVTREQMAEAGAALPLIEDAFLGVDDPLGGPDFGQRPPSLVTALEATLAAALEDEARLALEADDAVNERDRAHIAVTWLRQKLDEVRGWEV